MEEESVEMDIKIEFEEMFEKCFVEPLPTVKIPISSSIIVNPWVCLFCGMNTDENHSKVKVNEHIFSLWDKSCWKSLCEVFNLQARNYPVVENIFQKSKFCSQCLNLIRDIDFYLKCLNSIQERLRKAQENVKNLLEHNNSTSTSTWDSNNVIAGKVLYETLVLASNGNQDQMIQSDLQVQSLESHSPVLVSQPVDTEESYFKRLRRRCRNLDQALPTTAVLENENDFEDFGPEECDADPEATPPHVELVWKDDDFEERVTGNDKSLASSNSESDEVWNPKRGRKGQQKSKRTKKPSLLTSSSVRNEKPHKSRKLVLRKSKSEKLKCAYENCIFITSNEIVLTAHVHKIHLDDPTPYHCLVEECGMKFVSKSGFEDHSLKKHGGTEKTKIIPCPNCDRMFFYSWEMKKHADNVHTHWEKLRCSKCRKMFEAETEKSELEAHENLHILKLNANMPFSCVFCDRDFTNMFDLSTHVKMEHELSLMENKCDICKKVYDTKKKLQRHITEMHRERNPKLKCKKCDYIGTHKHALEDHQSCHSTGPLQTCHLCGQGYKTRSGIAYHFRTAHAEETAISKEKLYSCHICGKNFNSTCTLKAHEESHNTIKSYVCDLCGKCFKTKKNLHQHMRSHSDVKIRYGKKYRDRNEQTQSETHQLPTMSTFGLSFQHTEKFDPSPSSCQSSYNNVTPLPHHSQHLPFNLGTYNAPVSTNLLSRSEVNNISNFLTSYSSGRPGRSVY